MGKSLQVLSILVFRVVLLCEPCSSFGPLEVWTMDMFSHCEHNCVQWVDNPLSNNLVSEVSRPFSLLRVFLMIKCHPSMLIFVLILSPVTR